MGHCFGESYSVAVFHLPRPGIGDPERAVVQHSTRAGMLSWCAECDTHAAVGDHAYTAAGDHAYSAESAGLPLLSHRAVGTDSLPYRVVLPHDDSGDHVCQSKHHQPELDLRRIDFVHSVGDWYTNEAARGARAASFCMPLHFTR